jgi:hypothetical protein
LKRPPSGPPEPPYGSYAALLATFAGGVGASALVAARLGRRPPTQRALDLVILALATFKASRTLAHDEVTSFIREPFVEGMPPDIDDERPVRTPGPRRAIGELLTCSRCVGTWAAAGIAAVDMIAPRFGRMLSWSLAIGGANDWLQAGFAALTETANRSQEPAG